MSDINVEPVVSTPSVPGLYVSSSASLDGWPSVALYRFDAGVWSVNEKGFWGDVPEGGLPADLVRVGFGACA